MDYEDDTFNNISLPSPTEFGGWSTKPAHGGSTPPGGSIYRRDDGVIVRGPSKLAADGSIPSSSTDRVFLTPHQKAAKSQAAFEKRAIDLGYTPGRLSVEGIVYDAFLDVGPRVLRIQLKYADFAGDTVQVGSYHVKGNKRKKYFCVKYTRHEIDALVAYDDVMDRLYWIPPDVFELRQCIRLRRTEKTNRQGIRKDRDILYAKDFVW